MNYTKTPLDRQAHAKDGKSSHSMKPSLRPSNSIVPVKHKTLVQNEKINKTKKPQFAQFNVNAQKHLTNYLLYISHIRVNTQQAVAILFDGNDV